MHDHGSPPTRFDISSKPDELKNTDFSSMMGETKQLHSMQTINHHYHPQLSHLQQNFHQLPFQNQHPHQNDSLLYEYMVSQQQHPFHQNSEHQHFVQPQNSEQRNLTIPAQTLYHNQLQQQQQDHQLPQIQQNEQQQISKRCGEQYCALSTVQQRDHHQVEAQNYLFSNSTHQSQFHPTAFQSKSTEGQTKSYPGAMNGEFETTEREQKSYQDLDEIDDDLIDDEEEEDLRVCYEQCKQSLLLKQPNVASELLEFAENASLDIQRFFGRTKGEEDACDVYEDKWAATKSGRELYYADLIRIAQGGDTEPVSSKKSKKPGSLASLRISPPTTSFSSTASSSSSSSSVSSPGTDVLDTRARFSGRRDVSLGMGALNELFEVELSYQAGRCSSTGSSRTRHSTALRSRNCADRITPKMRERTFPNSFWKEPSSRISAGYIGVTAVTNLDYSHIAPMSNSKLPDFSDLMESWHGSVEALSDTGRDRVPALSVSLQHQQ